MIGPVRRTWKKARRIAAGLFGGRTGLEQGMPVQAPMIWTVEVKVKAVASSAATTYERLVMIILLEVMLMC